eukprot:1158454-Pelagomonas_calceolata.AAC.15
MLKLGMAVHHSQLTKSTLVTVLERSTDGERNQCLKHRTHAQGSHRSLRSSQENRAREASSLNKKQAYDACPCKMHAPSFVGLHALKTCTQKQR